jgi:hypothetical protein
MIVLGIILIVGGVAAGQRGYFTHATQNCASAGTSAVTVIAGPLNYFGANLKPRTAMCPSPVKLIRLLKDSAP